MNKSTILLSIIAWFVLTSLCHASPLKIEISLKDSSNLIIATKIINISNIDQKIPIWSCSYSASWIASSPTISFLYTPCYKNVIKMILLKPGEFDSGELDMAVSSKAKAGSLTFQMGFNLKGDEQDQIDIKSKDILWSNPITIEVNNAMLKNAWPAQ